MSYVEEAKSFLFDWLSVNINTKLKNDYFEFAKAALLFLGGDLPVGVRSQQLRAPGAFHHARWMAKVIYTIKIALLKKQLIDIIDLEKLTEISSLAVFLSVFYSRMWLTSSNGADAARNDLWAVTTLTKVSLSAAKKSSAWPVKFAEMASAARSKLEKHLSYLSERLVPLALFSGHVSTLEKNAIRKAMLKYEGVPEGTLQQVPYTTSFSGKSLRDFVGKDSWALFDLLSIERENFQFSVEEWESMERFKELSFLVSNLPVVNDAAERALGLATDFNTKTKPRTGPQVQALYKVVTGARAKLSSLATSSENVTKKSLKLVCYDW